MGVVIFDRCKGGYNKKNKGEEERRKGRRKEWSGKERIKKGRKSFLDFFVQTGIIRECDVM
jgi:hypothetical protein